MPFIYLFLKRFYLEREKARGVGGGAEGEGEEGGKSLKQTPRISGRLHANHRAQGRTRPPDPKVMSQLRPRV